METDCAGIFVGGETGQYLRVMTAKFSVVTNARNISQADSLGRWEQIDKAACVLIRFERIRRSRFRVFRRDRKAVRG